MVWKDQIEAARDEVAAIFAANNIAAPHLLGEKEKARHGVPPAYVWIPADLKDGEEPPFTPNVDEPRDLMNLRDGVKILCWGRDRDQTSALRQNLIVALNEAEQADFRIEGGGWKRPGAAFNQLGELFQLEVSISIPVPDGFVDLGTMAEPTAAGVVPTDIEASIGLAESADDEDVNYPITTTTADTTAG